MNDNRINFLIEQGSILARLEKGEALTLKELEGVLSPGCFSVLEILEVIRQNPDGITDNEIKEALEYPKASQVATNTLSALAKGGAIIREDLPPSESDSGKKERINFPV